MGHTDMGDAKMKGVRIRLEGGRLVDIDQRMLEALIAFASELLKADGAEDELRAIGRTAGELREWLDSAREKPGYGVPAVLLRHVGPELADVEAATEALARVENESPAEENRSAHEGGMAEGTQAALIAPTDPDGEVANGDLPAMQGGGGVGGDDDHAGDMGESRPGGEGAGAEPLMHISVRGQTVAVDAEMLRALVGYVEELLRSHTPMEVERQIGRSFDELEKWVGIAEKRSGMAIPRALLRHIGVELTEIESATMALASKPDVRVPAESPPEDEGLEVVAGADDADGVAAGENERAEPRRAVTKGAVGRGESASRSSAGPPPSSEVLAIEGDADGEEETARAGRELLPRIVRVEPLEGEVESFGEKAEFGIRRWRDLRADLLSRWDSGGKETSDGLLIREYMLMVELDLIENHKMTLTTGLPWVVESLEWDELTRQEQASWRQRELADVQEHRAAVEKREARWEKVRRLASWPQSVLRQRGG